MPDEAVVFSDGSAPDAARTHVLLVGVGHYPNLANGLADGGPAPLEDLKSPAASIRAIADWFLHDYNYPGAPLGSVALLVSEKPPTPFATPDGQPFQPPVPTYGAFEAAAKGWLKRGNGNEESRLILWFCGHGYGFGTVSSLLMADFDFSDDNMWDCALDLGTFVAGTEKYKAAEQLFFVDACRRPYPDMVQPGAATGRSPAAAVANPRGGYARKRKAPTFFSTGNNEPARAKPGDLSVFTQGFLRAVGGMGARNDTGEWRVSSLSMLEAIDHVSIRLTEDDFVDPQQPQGADARSLEVHRLKGDPLSPLYVKRDGQPLGPAELRYRLKGKPQARPCAAEEDEVELMLPPGDYNLELANGAAVIARAKKAASSPIYKTAMLKP